MNSNRIPPLVLAGGLIVLLSAFSLIPWVSANPRLAGSIWAAAGALLVFLVLVRRRAARAGRVLSYTIVPRPVHYVQLTMHTSIYLYWGWYWREVYHYAPLIVAQIVFVYVLDMLLCWSRRDKWILGFGPFPIVLSTNLFLWFKDDWFFLQFLLVSTGVLCKEFVTWRREGRRTHIFNPSAIALAVFSIGLLATHSTHLTWGEEVAVSLGRPPHIYLEIFAVGLVVQALFSVTLVTLAAAAALFVMNLVYTGSTGLYYFVDSNIPIAVFLGLHLLVTDPATSPRRNFGKVLFGAMYGALVFSLYAVLGWMGAPTFYDKLLCVPPLNLLVQPLDRAGAALEAHFRQLAWRPRQANFAHMAVWIALFAVMTATGFVGGRHPGSDPEFWRKACESGKRGACQTWVRTMNVSCQHGSGLACLTLGVVWNEGRVVARDRSEAGKNFGRACDLGMQYACPSLVALVKENGPDVLRPACDRGDGESCFILASLYYAGGGVPKDLAAAVARFRQSCADGWWRGCGGLAECYRAGQGTAADAAQASAYFEKACRGGVAASCFAVATMYRGMKDEARAQRRFQEACDFSVRHEIANTAYFRAGANLPAGTARAFCSQAEQ
jgi:hypothetical protein